MNRYGAYFIVVKYQMDGIASVEKQGSRRENVTCDNAALL